VKQLFVMPGRLVRSAVWRTRGQNRTWGTSQSGPLPLRLETWGYGETVLHWIASEGWLGVRDDFRNW